MSCSKTHSQKGFAPLLLVALAALAFLIYISISSIAPFKDKILSTLYPKPSSFAQDNTIEIEEDINEVMVSEFDNGKEIEVTGDQVLTVSLDANLATGYSWDIAAGNGDGLKKSASWFENTTGGLLGAPGKQVFRIYADNKGDYDLKLVYKRPWEKVAKAEKEYYLKVKSKGGATEKTKNAASKKPNFIKTTGNQTTSITKPTLLSTRLITALPGEFNWCSEVGCTPVKNQGSCGACWAFATVGVLEQSLAIKDRVTKDLSEQYLISCNSNRWNCNGGWFANDYHLNTYIQGEPGAGAVLESNFPYQASNLSCNPPHIHNEKLTSWRYVGMANSIPSVDDIKQAISTYGPINVTVCAGSLFSSYQSGVFSTNETCSGTVNHGVVLVGWNDSLGAWRLRNSWGTSWGEAGYMWITYGTSNVGYGANYIVYDNQSSYPTPTPTATPIPTPTAAPTPTPTVVPTIIDITPTPTNIIPTPTSTPTPTPTAIPTPTPSTNNDVVPPVVTITNPLNATFVNRNSTQNILVNASDNIGVTKVEFYVNSGFKCSDTTAPYSCSWKSSGKSGLSITIMALAYDAAGNTSTSTVRVTLK